jgi:pimeloyl-ACP methyl ester carboxylesterase
MSKKDYRKQLISGVIFNTMKKIESIDHKTLIFTGEYDKIMLPENAMRLARRLPNSTLSVIHNCGHLFLYDDLKPVLTELYTFLE